MRRTRTPSVPSPRPPAGPSAARRVRRALLGALLLATFATGAATAAPGGTAAHGRGHGACSRDASLLFCEDFESLPRGGATSLDWGVDTERGTLTVERERGRGHRQGQVLHVHTEDNGHAFLEADGFSAPGNSFFGRMWLRVAAFPTAPDWAHFTLVEATGEGDGSVVRPIGGQYVPEVDGGTALWGVGSDGGPTGDWTNWRASAPAAAGEWTCVEWEQDASDNRISVWLDGRAQPDLTVTTTEHGGNPVDFVFPRFDTVRIGWQLYQAGSAPGSYDVLLDDVALATHRLGCGS
ncbi:hypothetical protein [Streptomyces hoynatensis]|uniref:hypothetical protein n=1 Tax=Streptomyces hoynatensis TaxID=1141874 RepID=UPI001F4ED23D|nr:hypothetical protein [Streptomyces hoynatensis]